MGNFKIAFVPFNGETNRYIDLMKRAYTQLGMNVVPYTKGEKTDYIMLNWYESAGPKESLLRVFKLISFLLKGVKIVWTMHNKLPHETKYPFVCKVLMHVLSIVSYKIIVHSKESLKLFRFFFIKRKVIYVPHPNYIYEYGECKISNVLDDNVLRILFFGLIRDYKNVDLLIETMNELRDKRIILTISGSVNDEYKTYLEKKIDNNNSIVTNFNFVRDNEVADIISKSHILVFPYELKSSLNSGAVILSFSYRRTVLSSVNGTLKDMPDSNLFFSYQYKSREEHKSILKKELTDIYNKYSGNFNKLLDLGDSCFDVVNSNNSLEKTSEALLNIFQK